MKFALHFGNNTVPDVAGATRLGRLAEAAGFASVIAVDHVVLPDAYDSIYPYAVGGRLPGTQFTAMPDPLIWMAFVAALIAVEKTVRWRRVATYGTAAVLFVLGVLLLAAPGAVPGLTVPDSGPMDVMEPMGS